MPIMPISLHSIEIVPASMIELLGDDGPDAFALATIREVHSQRCEYSIGYSVQLMMFRQASTCRFGSGRKYARARDSIVYTVRYMHNDPLIKTRDPFVTQGGDQVATFVQME